MSCFRTGCWWHSLSSWSQLSCRGGCSGEVASVGGLFHLPKTVVAKLRPYSFHQKGSPEVSSHLASGDPERSQIEHGISECDLLISRISDERLRLASGIAECNSLRRLLADRQYTLRPRYRSSTVSRWPLRRCSSGGLTINSGSICT
jgi:hypothetical protein